MSRQPYIPIARADEDAGCQAREPFVLMVLGESMLPEFAEGEVIVIDPEGSARDGSYVLAWHNGEHIFRQLRIVEGEWFIAPLNPAWPTEKIAGREAIKGVIIQKKSPGKRGAHKHYR